MVLRLGVNAVAAGHRADFDAALVAAVAADQFVERRAHHVLFFADGGGHLLDRRRLVGGVDDGFERAFQFHGCHGH